MWALLGASLIAADPTTNLPALARDIVADGRIDPAEWEGAREVSVEGLRVRLGAACVGGARDGRVPLRCGRRVHPDARLPVHLPGPLERAGCGGLPQGVPERGGVDRQREPVRRAGARVPGRPRTVRFRRETARARGDGPCAPGPGQALAGGGGRGGHGEAAAGLPRGADALLTPELDGGRAVRGWPGGGAGAGAGGRSRSGRPAQHRMLRAAAPGRAEREDGRMRRSNMTVETGELRASSAFAQPTQDRDTAETCCFSSR